MPEAFFGDRGAGCVVYAEDTKRFLIARRSGAVNEPHTWGTWGGAAHADESPKQTAERELREETKYSGPLTLEPVASYRRGDFIYQNYVARVPHEFTPELDNETEDFAWVASGNWPHPRHFGFVHIIPKLEAMFPPAPREKKGKALRSAQQATGLYHATTWQAALRILRSNVVSLSPRGMDPSDANAQLDVGSRFYFLSCSSVRYGGYAYAKRMEVVFALDYKKVESDARIVPYDYWGTEFKKAAQERGDYQSYEENELRVVSTRPELSPASKYIVGVHVLLPGTNVESDELAALSSLLSGIKEQAEHLNLPVYFYPDFEDYKNQVTSRAVPLSFTPFYTTDETKSGITDNKPSTTLESVLTKLHQWQDFAKADPDADTLPTAPFGWSGWEIRQNLSSFMADIRNLASMPLGNRRGELHAAFRWLASATKQSGAKSVVDFYQKCVDRLSQKKTTRESVLREILSVYKDNFESSRARWEQDIPVGSDALTGLYLDKLGQVFHIESGNKPNTVLVRNFVLPENLVKEYDWVDWAKFAAEHGDTEDEIKEVAASGNDAQRMHLLDSLIAYYGIDNFSEYHREMRRGEAEVRYGSMSLDSIIDDYGLEATYGNLLAAEQSRPRRPFGAFVNRWLRDHEDKRGYVHDVLDVTRRKLKQYPRESKYARRVTAFTKALASAGLPFTTIG